METSLGMASLSRVGILVCKEVHSNGSAHQVNCSPIREELLSCPLLQMWKLRHTSKVTFPSTLQQDANPTG